MQFKLELGKNMNGLLATALKMGCGVLLGALLVMGGCSGEDQPPPKGKNKVVVAIVQPEMEPEEAEPVEKAVPEEKAAPQESSSNENQPVEGKEVQETTPKAEPEAETKAEVSSSQEAMETSPSTTKEEPTAHTEAAATGSAASTTTVAATSAEKNPPALEKGVARVGEGESLSAFAAREDTCGDLLKWTLIYRLNIKTLAGLGTWKDIAEKPLQTGVSLRFLPAADKDEQQNPSQARPWVVTVRSAQRPGRLAVQAVKLIESGLNVYIVRAEVKGKQWLRLRVGFYATKSQALEARDRIREILGNNDSWVARAGKSELEEFGV